MRYLLLLLLLTSCATAKKKAIELSEHGRHEEAIPFWAEAIKKDPDDEEIQNGFQSSLDFVSNDRLTRIRDKRMANNLQEAMEELKGLVDLQQKYHVKLDYNSSSFQGKEVHYTWPYYKSVITKKLQMKLPLGAESDHKDYYHVYNSMRDYGEVQKQIAAEGLKKCQELKRLPSKKPFFASYVNQFCHYFKGNIQGNSEVASVLYVKPKLEAQIENVDGANLGLLDSKIHKAMSESPWFHAEGANQMPVKLTGSYTWDHKTTNIKETHSYIEKVPYTTYELQPRTKVITENGISRHESYHENVPVTRYKEEHRYHYYYARKNTITITFSVKGSVQINKEVYPIAFQKEYSEWKVLHDQNLPQIGLYPKRDDVVSPMQKYEFFIEEFTDVVKNDLAAIWEKNYCSLPTASDLASIAENVTRCQRLPGYPEPFVDNWFRLNFGVTGKRAQELLGHY